MEVIRDRGGTGYWWYGIEVIRDRGGTGLGWNGIGVVRRPISTARMAAASRMGAVQRRVVLTSIPFIIF